MLRLAHVSATFGRHARGSIRAFASTIPTASEALDKFKFVLKEYRLANFNDAWPKRYVKEFVRGVDKNHDDFLEKDDFSSFLSAIGASDKLTPEELDQAMNEIIATVSMPTDSYHVPVDKMRDMMLDGIQRGDM